MLYARFPGQNYPCILFSLKRINKTSSTTVLIHSGKRAIFSEPSGINVQNEDQPKY